MNKEWYAFGTCPSFTSHPLPIMNYHSRMISMVNADKIIPTMSGIRFLLTIFVNSKQPSSYSRPHHHHPNHHHPNHHHTIVKYMKTAT